MLYTHTNSHHDELFHLNIDVCAILSKILRNYSAKIINKLLSMESIHCMVKFVRGYIFALKSHIGSPPPLVQIFKIGLFTGINQI